MSFEVSFAVYKNYISDFQKIVYSGEIDAIQQRESALKSKLETAANSEKSKLEALIHDLKTENSQLELHKKLAESEKLILKKSKHEIEGSLKKLEMANKSIETEKLSLQLKNLQLEYAIFTKLIELSISLSLSR